MRKYVILAVLFVLIASVGFASPRILTYQGSLLRPGGAAPVSDGTYDMRFSIYDVTSGGATLWTETDTAVQVTGGLFNTVLGDGTVFSSMFFSSNYDLWLEVEIDVDRNTTFDADELFSPRQRLTASPWAMDADRLEGRDASQFLSSAMPLTLTATTGSTAIRLTNPSDIQNVDDIVFTSNLAWVPSIDLNGGDIEDVDFVTADYYYFGTDPTFYRNISFAELVNYHDAADDVATRFGGSGYVRCTDGTAPYSCALYTGVHLPHGATVTEVRAWVYDDDGSGHLEIELRRYGNGEASTGDIMASAATTDPYNGTSVFEIYDDTIVNATVDNQTHHYMLRVVLEPDSASSLPDIRFYNARITFTMPRVAP